MLRVAAAALLICATLSPAAQGAWSSFHNDERNSGFQAGTDYQVYEDVWWSQKVKDTQIDSSPVVKDGVVLIGAWDKTIRALDAESGKEKWNATLAGIIYNTPAIVAGRVFIVDSTGVLQARDLQKGTVLETAAVGPTRGSITTHEGKLFIGNEAGVVHAFDTESLTLLWKFTISDYAPNTVTTGVAPATTTSCGTKFTAAGSQVRGAPAVYEGKVIFGSLNHWVFAVEEQGNSVQTTNLMWMFETNDAIFGSPAIDTDADRVLIGSYDEKVYALKATPSGEGPVNVGTGAAATACTALKNTATWTFNVPSDIGQSKVHSTPAIDATHAYFGANNGRVYAIKLSDGTKVWEFSTGGQVISSPAVSNGIVVVGSDDAKLYWLKASDGTKLKEFVADAPIKSSPAIDGDRTFIASFEGSIYMFGKKIPTRPDLEIGTISFTAGVLSVTVRNAGTGASTPSTLRLTVDGSLAADIAIAVIEAGQSTTVTHAMDLADGAHTVVATADQAGAVTESVESNNAKTETVIVAPAATSSKSGGGGGIKIPGVGVVPLLALLALVVAVRRRR